jgi:hypothetical protein
MILSNNKTYPSSKPSLTIVSRGREDVTCTQQEVGSAAASGRSKSLLWLIQSWLMEGFALYALTVYPIALYQLPDVESDCAAEDNDESNKDAISEPLPYWGGCWFG